MGSIAVVLVGYTLVIDAVGWIEVLKMSARYWSAFIFSYPRCWYVVSGVGGFIISIKSSATSIKSGALSTVVNIFDLSSLVGHAPIRRVGVRVR